MRGDADHPAPTAGDHERGRGLDAMKQRAGIDIDRPIPLPVFLFEQGPGHARGGIGHENIHPAKGGDGLSHQLFDLAGVAHVGPHDDGLAPAARWRRRCLQRGAIAKKIDGHIRAHARQCHGDGAANAPARASDDGG